MTLLPWTFENTPIYRVDAVISGEALPGSLKVYENETVEEFAIY